MFTWSKTYRLERDQLIPMERDKVFAFFSDAFNLERLAPIDIQKDTLIDYRIRLFGIPMRWRTRIERFEPDDAFVDNQIRGPYALWHHTHTFEDTAEGTLMRDIVLYRLPLGPLGALAHWMFVRRTLEIIFNYRRDALDDALEATA